MEKYIIIALILLFGLVYYVDNKQDNKVADLEKSSTLELDKNKPKGKSFWKIFVDHNKSKNYYMDRGITVKSSNKPDSDTSACLGVTKSEKDMIITRFAGYVLEYPCTVNQSGEYHIEYNPDGSLLSQRFRLYISLVLGQENGSIWWNGSYDSLKDTQSFRLVFWSDGKPRPNKPVEDWIKSAKKIKVIEEANLIVFKKDNYVSAFVKDLFDSKIYVSIRCDLTQDADPYELFSPFHNFGTKSLCTAAWKITDDITLKILTIQSKYAYKFYKIYQEINSKIYSIFIQYPKNPHKSTEK